jgi:hypothetical protein
MMDRVMNLSAEALGLKVQARPNNSFNASGDSVSVIFICSFWLAAFAPPR